MRNGEVQKLLPPRGLRIDAGARDAAVTAPPLLAVLWRRWQTLVLTVLTCLAVAAAFLLLATPTYRATATIFIQQNAPRVFADAAAAPVSETYLQTQADVIRSTPVLVRALEEIRYGNLRTFRSAPGNPAVWLQRGPLKVDVVKRSDVITVSMDSPHRQEAAVIVDGVVRAYVAEQSQATRKTAAEMVRVLEQERQQLQQKRAAAQEAMLAAQRERGEPIVRDARGNVVLGRLDTLSSALTAAEVATVELRAQQQATLAAMAGPEELRSFVEGLQFRGRDLGDREYDELRSQLVQYEAQLEASAGIQGAGHPRVRSIQRTVDYLKGQITSKEESIAEAHLSDVSSRLDAAEQKEAGLRAALEAARSRALDQTPGAVEYARLEAEVLDLEKRCEMLDRRIAELNVNSVDAGAMNVRVLQPAMVPDKPVKPNKALTLAAALLVGCVLGIGLATFREWQDARLRTPDELHSLLGLPLLGMVPRINRSLSPPERGQVLRLDSRSPVAEAYRSIRTSLYLGDARSAKTVLLASPAAGDGKSTTAANLAIAFAQAGERTLLLDCDLREPVQHLVFGVDANTGVSTALPGETKLQESIVPTRVPNLYLLPCGPVPRSPSEMLASDRFKFLAKTLCEAFDRVIIDSPPLEEVADARILAAVADATVLVLRMNKSMQRAGVLAVAGLNEVGANLMGAVANDVRVGIGAGYRVEGGPWQYAAGRDDDVTAPTHPRAALPMNGDHRPFPAPLNTALNQFPTEVVPTPGPNWPAEKP